MFASHTVLAHIRRADPPEASWRFSNTHPFERELAGRSWVFAHNGKLPGIEERPVSRFRPVGDTDSEHAFCLLLDAMRDALPPDGEAGDIGLLLDRLVPAVSEINRYGEFNFLLSDGEHLVVHAHTFLHALERECRVGEGDQAVFLAATHPLTDDEPLACLLPNTLSVYRRGRPVGMRATCGRAPDRAWERQRAGAEAVGRLRREAARRWAETGGADYWSG